MSSKTTRELAHLGYIHVHIYSFTSPLLSLTVVGTVLAVCVCTAPVCGGGSKGTVGAWRL